jgi:hypothetical protein
LFSQVNSENDKKKFNAIWEEVCKEKGFECEPTSSRSDLFLIYSDKIAIGTVELVPYENNKNIADSVFPFYSIDVVKDHPSKIFEIDKVAILKKYRGSNISKIFSIIYTYALENRCTHGIMLLEPIFYRALRIFYRIPIKRVTKEKIFYKGDYVVPSIIDFIRIKKNISDFNWALKIKEY